MLHIKRQYLEQAMQFTFLSQLWHHISNSIIIILKVTLIIVRILLWWMEIYKYNIWSNKLLIDCNWLLWNLTKHLRSRIKRRVSYFFNIEHALEFQQYADNLIFATNWKSALYLSDVNNSMLGSRASSIDIVCKTM